MRYWERFSSPVISPIEKTGWNFDDYYEEYFEALKKNDCMTCKYYHKIANSSQCRFKRMDSGFYKQVSDYNGPNCIENGGTSNWEPIAPLDIDSYFLLHEDINEKKDTDLYEIYEYATGRSIKEKRTKVKTFLFIPYIHEYFVDKPEVIYYILKNKKYYLCNSGTWELSFVKRFKSFCNPRGFLPLTDFRRILNTPYLCTFTDYDKAVKMVETLDCQKKQQGTIVYTNENTIDTLTQKFIELEKEEHLEDQKDDKIRQQFERTFGK